jgi:hypothetical protein
VDILEIPVKRDIDVSPFVPTFLIDLVLVIDQVCDGPFFVVNLKKDTDISSDPAKVLKSE